MPQTNSLSPYDSSWDYATIFEDVNTASDKLIELLGFLADCEVSSQETDAIVIAKIAQVEAMLNATRRLLLPGT